MLCPTSKAKLEKSSLFVYTNINIYLFELVFHELHLVLHLSFERHQDKIVMLDLKTN